MGVCNVCVWCVYGVCVVCGVCVFVVCVRVLCIYVYVDICIGENRWVSSLGYVVVISSAAYYRV